jgi:serine/threonine protein kinase
MSIIIKNNWDINFDDIAFKDKIGKGQFGNVYRAEYYGSEVCVKRITSDYKEDKELVKCVAREIEILKYVGPLPVTVAVQ